MLAIVTGASRGLGLEISRQLVAADWSILAISRTSSSEVQDLVQAHPQQVRFASIDLASPSKIVPLLEEHIAPKEAVHGLVNNAASAYDDLATNMSLDALDRMFQVNVVAPMLLTKWAIRRMLLNRTAGSLVHLSSVSVHTGYKGLSMYAASKGAIEAYSKNISREWGTYGIRSNCVVPGFMETDMSSTLTAEQKDRIYRRTALKKPTKVESAAAMVVYLLTEQARSITGQNIFVDSGTL